MNLTVAHAPHVNTREATRFTHDESNMAAVRRPWIGGNAAARILGDLRDLFVFESQNVKLSIFVAEGDALSVRRPTRLREHGVEAVRQFFRLARAVLVDEVKLIFAIHVRNERNL